MRLGIHVTYRLIHPTGRGGRAVRSLTAACAVVALGCDPSFLTPDPDALDPMLESAACIGGRDGATHVGTIGTERWGAGVHRVPTTVRVTGALTLDAGALVCMGPSAALSLDGGSLVASGSAGRPVMLTTADPATPWGGIDRASASVGSRLAHVRIEHASRGLWDEPGNPRTGSPVRAGWTIQDAHFRQIRGAAADLVGATTLLRTVVDSACSAGASGCAALRLGPGSRLEDSTVRGSGGDGVAGGVSLVRSRIEASVGVGLVGGADFEGSRIVGGRSYPARVSPATTLLAHADSLRGNGRDTILILGRPLNSGSTSTAGFTRGSLHVSSRIPIRLEGEVLVARDDTLYLEPGASVSLDSAELMVGGRIAAGVDGGEPVTLRAGRGRGLLLFVFALISGNTPSAPAADGGALRGAHLEGVDLAASRPVRLEDLRISDSDVRLSGEGVWLTGSVLDRSGLTLDTRGGGAVRITVRDSPGAGIVVRGPGARILGCRVTGSRGDGIRAEASVTIQDCELQANAGVAVRAGVDLVDARFNWWGDPGGPHGPAGGGVLGNVLFEPYRTAPLTAPREQRAPSSCMTCGVGIPSGHVEVDP